MESHLTNRLILICSMLVSVQCAATAVKKATLEDKFVEHFGSKLFARSARSTNYGDLLKYVLLVLDDPADFKAWFTIRNWWYMPGEPSLRKFCEEVHTLTGNEQKVVDWVLYKPRPLNFTDPKYPNRLIDVVEYSIEREKKPVRQTTTEKWKPKKGGKRFYIAQGLQLECVFTLKPKEVGEDIIFKLNKHVCGIQDVSPFTTPNVEDLLKDISPFSGGPGMNSAERALGTPSDLFD